MFNVFGKQVKIVFKPLKDNDGLYDRELKEIHLDKDLEGQALVVAALHEFVHAVLDRTSLSVEIPDHLEDPMCDNIAKALAENFDFEI